MDDGTGSVDGFYIQAVGNTAGDPIRASVAAAGSFGEAATTTGYSANAWQHACGVFTSATSRAAFLNGGGKGTNAISRAPSGLSRTMVGRYNAGASNVYADAAIAEAAIWDTDLTDAEVAILATGVSPLFVRPQNLVFYAPLSGSNATETDIIGGASITWVNTPTKAEHPRIIRPSAKILTFPSAGGGTNNYTLSGSVTHTLTPAATFSINRAYSLAGAVSYTLTPSATLAINRAYSLTGAASFTLTPSAAFDIDRAYALSGAVTLSLSPAATMTYTAAGSAAITGAVTYTLTPSAAFAINRAYTLTGAVTHTLSVAAAMQYTAQQAIEPVIQGGHYFPRVTVNDWRERSAKQRREYLERLLGLAEELPEAVEEEVEALIEAQGVETPAQVVRLDVVRVNRLIAQIEQITEDEDETLFLLMAS